VGLGNEPHSSKGDGMSKDKRGREAKKPKKARE
jgi:hypothetical protein